MKKFIRSFRLWRYRRLYRMLVFMYLRHPNTRMDAVTFADTAFIRITGLDYIDDVLCQGGTRQPDSELISSPSIP